MQNDISVGRKKPAVRRSPVALIILALCGIFIIYLTGGQLWQLAHAKMLNLQFLTPGVLQQTVAVNCILVKNELPIAAPAAGKIELVVKDEEKVKAGTLVANINTGDTGGLVGLKAPGGGLLCTHVDGLEELLKPGQLDVLDIAAVEKIDGREKEASSFTKGQTVLKVIDNLMPLGIYFEVPDTVPGDKLAVGKNVYFLWQDNEIKGRLEWVRETAGKKAALLTAENVPDAMLHNRKADIKLVTGENSGFIVPSGAVVEENGQKGIYTVQKQRARWVEVKVQNSLSGQCVIRGEGLNQDIRYITNPHWVRIGDLVE